MFNFRAYLIIAVTYQDAFDEMEDSDVDYSDESSLNSSDDDSDGDYMGSSGGRSSRLGSRNSYLLSGASTPRRSRIPSASR